MPDQDRLHVRTAEFARVAERIEHVTTLTSRLNVLPFDDKAARASLLSEIVGKPVHDSASRSASTYSSTKVAPSWTRAASTWATAS